MDAIKEWVVNIATVMIFVVTVQMIMPARPIRKMINLALGLIVIITIIKPVYKAAKNGFSFEDIHFMSSIDLDKNRILAESKDLEQQQLNQILEVYRKKIADRIKNCISEIEGVEYIGSSLVVDENTASEEFGTIRSIHIIADTKREDINMDRISIGRIDIQTENSKESMRENKQKEKEIADLEIKIKEKISSLLQISQNAISVTIGGE